jgi:hypothetical protein
MEVLHERCAGLDVTKTSWWPVRPQGGSVRYATAGFALPRERAGIAGDRILRAFTGRSSRHHRSNRFAGQCDIVEDIEDRTDLPMVPDRLERGPWMLCSNLLVIALARSFDPHHPTRMQTTDCRRADGES